MERSTIRQVISDKRALLDRIQYWRQALLDAPDSVEVAAVIRDMTIIIYRYN